MWLALGGACFATWSRNWISLLLWLIFWGAASWLVLGNAMTPDVARYLWLIGLMGIIGWRIVRPSVPSTERIAQFALSLTFAYICTNSVAGSIAEGRVAQLMNMQGYSELESVMVGPSAANPFQGNVVVATKSHYILGGWNWLAAEPFSQRGDPLERNLDDPVIQAAASHIYARRFLVWSRYPYGVVEEMQVGQYRVRFLDARYAGMNRGISGPVVMLDRDLKVLPGN